MNVFGQIGGLIVILHGIIGFIIAPIATHEYTITAISKLYTARTKSKGLFKSPETKKVEKNPNEEESKNIEKVEIQLKRQLSFT